MTKHILDNYEINRDFIIHSYKTIVPGEVVNKQGIVKQFNKVDTIHIVEPEGRICHITRDEVIELYKKIQVIEMEKFYEEWEV